MRIKELKDLIIDLFIENGEVKKELQLKDQLLNETRQFNNNLRSERDCFYAELIGIKNRPSNKEKIQELRQLIRALYNPCGEQMLRDLLKLKDEALKILDELDA